MSYQRPDERMPLNVESGASSSDKRKEYLKSCFEKNIYSRVGQSEAGHLFQCTLIAVLQIFIPLRIIIDNLDNYTQCHMFGNMIMAWDTLVVGTALIYLLWLTIINDTMKSMRGFEFNLGLPNLPRKWAIYMGMTITPIANGLTGLAASCVLLSSEVTVVDVAKDSMALFFINRLDEDFGQLHSMWGVLKRRLNWMEPHEEDLDDGECADSMLEQFGPWKDIDSTSLYHTITTMIEFLLFGLAFTVPFFYFACAV
jgi:hypothetical protein